MVQHTLCCDFLLGKTGLEIGPFLATLLISHSMQVFNKRGVNLQNTSNSVADTEGGRGVEGAMPPTQPCKNKSYKDFMFLGPPTRPLDPILKLFCCQIPF